MDMDTFKVLELLLIVAVVGYFFFRQRQSLQRLKDEREAKQVDTDSRSATDGDDNPGSSH